MTSAETTRAQSWSNEYLTSLIQRRWSKDPEEAIPFDIRPRRLPVPLTRPWLLALEALSLEVGKWTDACLQMQHAVEARVRGEATNKRKCLMLDDLCSIAAASANIAPGEGCDLAEKVKKRKRAGSLSDSGSELTELDLSSDDESSNDTVACSPRSVTTKVSTKDTAAACSRATKACRLAKAMPQMRRSAGSEDCNSDASGEDPVQHPGRSPTSALVKDRSDQHTQLHSKRPVYRIGPSNHPRYGGRSVDYEPDFANDSLEDMMTRLPLAAQVGSGTRRHIYRLIESQADLRQWSIRQRQEPKEDPHPVDAREMADLLEEVNDLPWARGFVESESLAAIESMDRAEARFIKTIAKAKATYAFDLRQLGFLPEGWSEFVNEMAPQCRSADE